ncbi:hypothetical protein [Staphylococcus sp. IVB6214]|uniref:hypothetical protein n=1 Tax=Staphylococcus sp. IVB6214 TaxID=2989766 RepID=UPI0021CF2907|nr:hypothetical protein [Staphylococcus sp. IVB6214]UXR83213.1 hypothetical protein MUA51_03945 [Staphylococcus sp. IVB6214]
MFKVIFRTNLKEIIVTPFNYDLPRDFPSKQATAEFIEYLESKYKSYRIITMPGNTEVEFID